MPRKFSSLASRRAALVLWRSQRRTRRVSLLRLILREAGARAATGRCVRKASWLMLIKRVGETARIPTLWIYAENDGFFNPRLVRKFYEAFIGAGGIAELIQTGPYGREGHNLFNKGGGASGGGRWSTTFYERLDCRLGIRRRHCRRCPRLHHRKASPNVRKSVVYAIWTAQITRHSRNPRAVFISDGEPAEIQSRKRRKMRSGIAKRTFAK